MKLDNELWQQLRSNPGSYTLNQLTSIELHCFTKLTTMALKTPPVGKNSIIKEVGTIMKIFKTVVREMASREEQ